MAGKTITRNCLSDEQALKLKNAMVLACRSQIPVDTGNMQLNAVYAISTRTGFKIVFDQRHAYYLPYVDMGINPLTINSKKVKANKGCVCRAIMAGILELNHFRENNYKMKYKQKREYLINEPRQSLIAQKSLIQNEATAYPQILNEEVKKGNMEIGFGYARMVKNFKKSLSKAGLTGYEFRDIEETSEE